LDTTPTNDRSSDFNPKAINGPFVTALKRASWADKNVSQEPESLKDQIGLYHLAPPRTGTVEYEARVAAELVTYRQEYVGESKTRINAKAHNLDYSGRLQSVTDFNSTIGNFAMIITFIAENAKDSELCIRAGHIPSSHRKSIIDFIPQLIDFGITINLTLEFIPTS
jgi:hypothetical protein